MLQYDKLSCMNCLTERRERNKQIIDKMPETVEPKEPPLGYIGIIAMTEEQAIAEVNSAYLLTGALWDVEQ